MTPLRKRMLQDMGIRNLATNTQLAYVQQKIGRASCRERVYSSV